jgi:hypothetical protein
MISLRSSVRRTTRGCASASRSRSSAGSGATPRMRSGPRCSGRRLPAATERCGHQRVGCLRRRRAGGLGRGRAADGISQAAHLSRAVERSGRGQGRRRRLGGDLLRGPEGLLGPRPHIAGHVPRLRPASVRSSSGTPMAVWQPRQARLPGLTPDEVREHMSPRLRDLDSRRNRGPHTGSRSPHTRRQGPARRGAGAVLMDHHCQGWN